jgi:hypothetical protein
MRKLLALAAVLACTACGGSGGAKVTARIVGGQARERALAREILRKLGSPSPVSVVRFLGYQHDGTHHWPGRRMDVTGHQAFPGASWEEYLFGYSYAVVARERHIPVGFVSFRDLGYGGLDNVFANAPLQPISDSGLHAFEAALRSKAKVDHASVRFHELRPGPVALEATLTTKRPGPFLERDAASFLRPPDGLFGFLLRVTYPSGKVAFSRGVTPGGGGTSWDPRLLGCIGGLVDISSPGARGQPPTCPAG